jgi:phosphatidylglycerol---prolipoprotein diacylglyceryl transferase
VFPELRYIAGHTQVLVSVHALAVAAGVVAGALLAAWRAREPGVALAAVALVAVTALVGAHGLFVLLHGAGPGLWTGGLASMGGIVAGLAASWSIALATRRPAGELLDAIVPAALLALAVGRIGCFFAGCCYGRPTALPWGIVFPQLGPPARHPLQLYSAAGDLALLLLLAARAAGPGVVACRGCIGFGMLRALLETLRDPATTDTLLPGWLTLPQVLALLLAVGGAATLKRLRPHAPIEYASGPEERRAWPMRRR